MKSSWLFFSLVLAGMMVFSSPRALPQSHQSNLNQQAIAISASYTAGTEATGVQDALNRFVAAVASQDVQQLLAAGIRPASAKGWQRFFKENPRAKLTDRCAVSDLYISDNTANWSCTEVATVISEGKPVPFAHLIRFTFTRTNGQWIISDRR